jgi:dTDP-glucose 4,6-dehydratase
VRILVAGGAGFIGSNFVIETLKGRADTSVTVLDALTYAGRLDNLHGALDQIKFVHGDIRDYSLVDQLVSQNDLVINFAAESHNDNSLKNALPFLETNVLGTFNLIQCCVKHDARYHHISTDEVFGDLELNDAIRFTPASAYNPSSPYSASKASSDMLVRAWVRSFGLRATISTCSNNYGPKQHEEKLIPRATLLAANGVKPKIYGSGQNVRDWIHVQDHVNGVWAVLDYGEVGRTYLLGASAERTNLQVVETILRELNLPGDFYELIPDRPGHDLRYAIDASETISELGWTPNYKSFEDGVRDVIAHYAEKARLKLIDVSIL